MGYDLLIPDYLKVVKITDHANIYIYIRGVRSQKIFEFQNLTMFNLQIITSGFQFFG